MSLYLFVHCSQVDTQTDRHGGEIVGQVLKDHNVKFLFCLSGGHISPILVAAEKQKIRVVDVRDEVRILILSFSLSCIVCRVCHRFFSDAPNFDCCLV